MKRSSSYEVTKCSASNSDLSTFQAGHLTQHFFRGIKQHSQDIPNQWSRYHTLPSMPRLPTPNLNCCSTWIFYQQKPANECQAQWSHNSRQSGLPSKTLSQISQGLRLSLVAEHLALSLISRTLPGKSCSESNSSPNKHYGVRHFRASF